MDGPRAFLTDDAPVESVPLESLVPIREERVRAVAMDLRSVL
ncbi:MAG TPA: hypothetical protein VGB78_05575 [Thermoplasmata archaeon]|jgi:hypothetical protein